MEDATNKETNNKVAADKDKAQPQAAGAGGEHVSIKVKAADGSEIYFKIKKSAPLKKLMDAYCTRTGFNSSACRFIFEGERIKDEDTAESLSIEDGDEIDVMVEQSGGKF